MIGLSGAEWLMILLAIMLMVAVAATLRNLSRRNGRNDAGAIACAVVAIFILALFGWAQNKAESEQELKHAAEHRAVQEQVESVQHF